MVFLGNNKNMRLCLFIKGKIVPVSLKLIFDKNYSTKILELQSLIFFFFFTRCRWTSESIEQCKDNFGTKQSEIKTAPYENETLKNWPGQIRAARKIAARVNRVEQRAIRLHLLIGLISGPLFRIPCLCLHLDDSSR